MINTHHHKNIHCDELRLPIKYKKIALLMGGDSPEREISLLSGQMVLNTLLKFGINIFTFDPSEQNILELTALEFDAVIIMLHGGNGENGVIQGILNYLKLPYNGSGVMASAIAMDKYRTKLIWANKIQMPIWQYVTKQQFDAHDFNLNIDLPVIVKPANGGSTIGLSKVYNFEELTPAIHLAFSYDAYVLVEELIIGDEYSITLDNNNIYPIVHIKAQNNNYDYQNKYFTDTTEYVCPSNLDMIMINKINKQARIAYELIGADGIVRIDFMVNHIQEYFLEMNTLAGMTSHSLVPLAFQANGTGFDDLCLHIVNNLCIHNN